MDFISKITNFIPTISWVKVGIGAAIIGAIFAGIHGIIVYGQQSEIIKQLEKDTQQQQKQNEESLKAAQAAAEANILALKKERDDAIYINLQAQQQLDSIKTIKPSDDKMVSPIIANTLNWLRSHRVSGDH